MNLFSKLQARESHDNPIRVGVIGAGKFASMFLAQVRHIPGMHLMGLADLSLETARAALESTGWNLDDTITDDFDTARTKRRTALTQDADTLIGTDGMDVIIDATGIPSAGIKHALLAAENGRHMVMVNVEADVLAGPWLARQFASKGLVYSMAYGDQPALICEMVDWVRTCGFSLVAAGKGTKYLPEYRYSTPDTVWNHYGLTAGQARTGGMNPQMFNSFLDGTKSAIEMAAVANATGLVVPKDGLAFPPCGVADLPTRLKPAEHGGVLEQAGMVEVISSQNRDGSDINDNLRWGVYVTFESSDVDTRGDYARRCFREYGVSTDESGRYASLYRPSHLIGQELAISVANAVLRGEATGTATHFSADVVAVAKTDLAPGDQLDGEGGFTVYGRLSRAADSLRDGALPIGLASRVRLKQTVARDQVIRWSDVEERDDQAVRIRRLLEADWAQQQQ